MENKHSSYLDATHTASLGSSATAATQTSVVDFSCAAAPIALLDWLLTSFLELT